MQIRQTPIYISRDDAISGSVYTNIDIFNSREKDPSSKNSKEKHAQTNHLSTSRTFLDFNLNLLAKVCRLDFNLQQLNFCFPQNRHRNSCTAAAAPVPPLSFPGRGMKNTKNRGPKEKSRGPTEKSRGLKEKNRSRQEEEEQRIIEVLRRIIEVLIRRIEVLMRIYIYIYTNDIFNILDYIIFNMEFSKKMIIQH